MLRTLSEIKKPTKMKLIPTHIRQRIIARDGNKDILLHFTEELGELLSSINHCRRNRQTPENVMKEIADMMICLEFVKEIVGIDECNLDARISAIAYQLEKEVNKPE